MSQIYVVVLVVMLFTIAALVLQCEECAECQEDDGGEEAKTTKDSPRHAVSVYLSAPWI
jgi:hypothetical protein